MKAVIIANGDISDYDFCKSKISDNAFIICADGGMRHCNRMNIIPDVIIGDFDSLSQNELAGIKNENIEIIKYPTQKDMTDTELAVQYALDNKLDDITLLGCTGSRMDHSLANIYLLKKMIQNSAYGRIIDQQNEIQIVDKEATFKKGQNQFISLLPLDCEVSGVSTTGLLYELENATLKNNCSLGVSNEFISEEATISVKSGMLLVIITRELPPYPP